MSDENSTQIWSNQTSTNQSWNDNDFMLDFWEEEKVEEIKSSEGESEKNFDINSRNEDVETKDVVDKELNNDLFWENSNVQVEDSDSENIIENTQNNDDNKDDDFFSNMSLNSESNSNEGEITSKMLEEDNEKDEIRLDIPVTNVEDNADLENESNGKSNLDELFWEKNDKNEKLWQGKIEGFSTQESNIDENHDFSINIDEEKTSNVWENMGFSNETETDISKMNDNKIEEISNVSDKNYGSINWIDDIFWDTKKENNDILEQQDLDNSQWENVEDSINFSFDNNSDEVRVEETDEQSATSNNLEEMFIGDKNDMIDISGDDVENKENNDLTLKFAIDSHNDDSQVINNNMQDDEEQVYIDNNETSKDNDLFWDESLAENKDNDLFWDNSLPQNEDNKDLDNQNLTYDNLIEWGNQTNWEFPLNDTISWEDNKDDTEVQDQELFTTTDSRENTNQETSQPDMMNLLWWQPIDFSYEENATDIQQSENNSERNQDFQDVLSTDLQDSFNSTVIDNQSEDGNLMVVESDSNSNLNSNPNPNPNITEDINIAKAPVSDMEIQENNNLNIGEQWANTQNLEENKINELPIDSSNNIPQVSENTQNQVEVWSIKSTLSLDEILDSELKSNPQFTDNSISVPNNTQTKSTSMWSKKTTIFMWLGIFLLLCFVVVLAFPSVNPERKTWDVVDTGTVIDEPKIIEEEPESVDEEKTDTPEYDETHGDDQEELEKTKKEEEDIESVHGSWPTLELIEEEYTPPEEIEPYTLEETEQEEPSVEETENISADDIQLKISSFKSQGEWYKKVGENESNEKVIKYASYVIRLCEDYQLQIDNLEWIDEETYSSFETKVSWFISKIEANLHPVAEVETVYTQARLDNDEEKEATRTYLENR